jgi:signal transduction histidine kinase
MERTGIVMEVRGEELNPRLPLEKETALFRIVQEAINNVAKHAKASQVTLTLESGDEKCRLIIVDDGIGFDSKTHHQPGREPEWGIIRVCL